VNGDLDIAANRKARKWTGRELAARALWELVQPLFRFSPRVCWGWRRGLLRLFGAKIGRNVHVHPTVQVTIPWNLLVEDFAAIGDGVRIYNLGQVFIGRAATLSQGAHLCAGTHDHTRPDLPLIKAEIRVEEGPGSAPTPTSDRTSPWPATPSSAPARCPCGMFPHGP